MTATRKFKIVYTDYTADYKKCNCVSRIETFETVAQDSKVALLNFHKNVGMKPVVTITSRPL